MSAMAVRYGDLPVREGGFTIDDLEQMPEDGRCYELVDGVLLVSPAPRWEHQWAAQMLGHVLMAARPSGLAVFGLPLDVRRGRRTSLQPDVLVVRRADLVDGQPYLAVPLLAVEVLSPTSVDIDLGLKRWTYARLGVPSYWVVDADEPSVTAFALHAERYDEIARAVGGDPLSVTEPFTVRVVPSELRIRR